MPKRRRKALRKISADEFARRLKQTVDETDKRFAFFLGAGCSVSSGIPDAGGLVRDNWLPRLRDFRAPDRKDLEAWAKTEIRGYDAKNPAASYGKVMQELFLQPEDRQREVELLCDGRFPAFGYATTAALVTTPDGCFNVVLTTNFDDLMADALYLFTQARPLVIHHESLASFIRPTRTRPLIVKLHGDHRLSPQNTAQETKTLKEDIDRQVQSLLHDRGLVFVGYGGNDQGIRSVLKALPDEALPLGVYWVSGKEPEAALRPWLESRDAIWVDSGDFDELMLIARNVFDLRHPDRKRLEEVFEKYMETYMRLSGRVTSLPDTAPDAPALKQAVARTDQSLPDEFAVDTAATRLLETNPDEANAIYAKGVEQFPHSAWLLTVYARFLEVVREDYDRADQIFGQAIAAEPEYAYTLRTYAEFLQHVREDYDLAEIYYEQALAADPDNAYTLNYYALFLDNVRNDSEGAHFYHERAVAAGPANEFVLGGYAIFLEEMGEHDKAERYYRRCIAANPDQPYYLRRYSKFLRNIRQQPDRADEYLQRAAAVRERRASKD